MSEDSTQFCTPLEELSPFQSDTDGYGDDSTLCSPGVQTSAAWLRQQNTEHLMHLEDLQGRYEVLHEQVLLQRSEEEELNDRRWKLFWNLSGGEAVEEPVGHLVRDEGITPSPCPRRRDGDICLDGADTKGSLEAEWIRSKVGAEATAESKAEGQTDGQTEGQFALQEVDGTDTTSSMSAVKEAFYQAQEERAMLQCEVMQLRAYLKNSQIQTKAIRYEHGKLQREFRNVCEELDVNARAQENSEQLNSRFLRQQLALEEARTEHATARVLYEDQKQHLQGLQRHAMSLEHKLRCLGEEKADLQGNLEREKAENDRLCTAHQAALQVEDDTASLETVVRALEAANQELKNELASAKASRLEEAERSKALVGELEVRVEGLANELAKCDRERMERHATLAAKERVDADHCDKINTLHRCIKAALQDCIPNSLPRFGDEEGMGESVDHGDREAGADKGDDWARELNELGDMCHKMIRRIKALSASYDGLRENAGSSQASLQNKVEELQRETAYLNSSLCTYRAERDHGMVLEQEVQNRHNIVAEEGHVWSSLTSVRSVSGYCGARVLEDVGPYIDVMSLQELESLIRSGLLAYEAEERVHKISASSHSLQRLSHAQALQAQESLKEELDRCQLKFGLAFDSLSQQHSSQALQSEEVHGRHSLMEGESLAREAFWSLVPANPNIMSLPDTRLRDWPIAKTDNDDESREMLHQCEAFGRSAVHSLEAGEWRDFLSLALQTDEKRIRVRLVDGEQGLRSILVALHYLQLKESEGRCHVTEEYDVWGLPCLKERKESLDRLMGWCTAQSSAQLQEMCAHLENEERQARQGVDTEEYRHFVGEVECFIRKILEHSEEGDWQSMMTFERFGAEQGQAREVLGRRALVTLLAMFEDQDREAIAHTRLLSQVHIFRWHQLQSKALMWRVDIEGLTHLEIIRITSLFLTGWAEMTYMEYQRDLRILYDSESAQVEQWTRDSMALFRDESNARLKLKALALDGWVEICQNARDGRKLLLATHFSRGVWNALSREEDIRRHLNGEEEKRAWQAIRHHWIQFTELGRLRQARLSKQQALLLKEEASDRMNLEQLCGSEWLHFIAGVGQTNANYLERKEMMDMIVDEETGARQLLETREDKGMERILMDHRSAADSLLYLQWRATLQMSVVKEQEDRMHLENQEADAWVIILLQQHGEALCRKVKLREGCSAIADQMRVQWYELQQQEFLTRCVIEEADTNFWIGLFSWASTACTGLNSVNVPTSFRPSPFDNVSSSDIEPLGTSPENTFRLRSPGMSSTFTTPGPGVRVPDQPSLATPKTFILTTSPAASTYLSSTYAPNLSSGYSPISPYLASGYTPNQASLLTPKVQRRPGTSAMPIPPSSPSPVIARPLLASPRNGVEKSPRLPLILGHALQISPQASPSHLQPSAVES